MQREGMREKDKHDGSVYEKPRVHSERKKPNSFGIILLHLLYPDQFAKDDDFRNL